jgi:multicomponent K+:H+ antiporter subunit G
MISELPLWVTVPGSVLMVLAGVLALVGAIGLLRLPDFYSRMHGPTLGTTLGTGCVLLVSMLVAGALAQRPILHELLIGAFLLITAPVTAMLLMRAVLYRADGGQKPEIGKQPKR